MLPSKNILQPVVEALDKDLSLLGLKGSIKIEGVKGTNFLSVSINHKSHQRAIEILKNTADNFIEYGNNLYAKKIKLLEERMKALEIQKQSIKKEINSLQGVIKDKVTPDYPLIQNTLTSYEAIYSQLDDKIYSLKSKLANTKKFELFEPPLKPKNPISPKKKQNITIAAVIGLMLGVLIAFFREFWVNSTGGEESTV
jgi:capsular polysaccharide biosynthesis protein